MQLHGCVHVCVDLGMYGPVYMCLQLHAPWVHVFECTVHVGPIGPSLCGPTHGVGPAFSCGARLWVMQQCVCTSHMHYVGAVHCECVCVSTGASTIQVGSPAIQALIIE